MPIQRSARFWDKKITRSGAGFDDLLSKVVDSRTVDAIPSNEIGGGLYVLEAGHVMAYVDGDDQGRIKPVAHNPAGGTGGAGAYVAADIAGILSSPHTFSIDVENPAGDDGDRPVALLHFGANFDTAELVGYEGNEAAVEAALPHCKFT